MLHNELNRSSMRTAVLLSLVASFQTSATYAQSWAELDSQRRAPAAAPAGDANRPGRERFDRGQPRDPLLAYRRGEQPAPNQAVRGGPIQPDPSFRAASANAASGNVATAAGDQSVGPQHDNARQLAPQSATNALRSSNSSAPRQNTLRSVAPGGFESFTTAGAGLGIVLGLFLLCMWLMRKGGSRPNAPLPRDVVTSLGRIPLAARHFAQLLQVGNKLVLVSVTANGVDPITEITEPAEVDRLLGLCKKKSKHSTTAEFQQVMRQLSKEPAQGFIDREASGSLAAAHRK